MKEKGINKFLKADKINLEETINITKTLAKATTTIYIGAQIIFGTATYTAMNDATKKNYIEQDMKEYTSFDYITKSGPVLAKKINDLIND